MLGFLTPRAAKILHARRLPAIAASPPIGRGCTPGFHIPERRKNL